MTLQELKMKIENRTMEYDFLIFKSSESDFIALQYSNAIAKNLGWDVKYISDLTPFYSKPIFEDENILYIFRTDEICLELEGLERNHNLIIICNKVNKFSNPWYNNYILEIPKLEEWQLRDFAMSKLEGLPQEDINWLVAVSKNIERLSLEIERLELFSKAERYYLFKEFKHEGVYSDLSQKTVFDLSNALVTHDINAVVACYKEINNIDFNLMGFIQILYNNFRNVILIQLSKTPNIAPEGMSSKQFYTIRKTSVGIYTKEQLLKIFEMLTGIDKKIKTGMIDTDILLNYIITFILGVN